MKKLVLLIAIMVATGVQAQVKKVEFKLQSTGAFLSENGENYVVVPFEGKSANELYSMVKGNVLSLYNDPKEVMSEIEGEAINIFAFKKDMWVVKSLGATGVYGGKYKLVFRFKDGRIRVDAPSISEKLEMTDGAFTNTIGIPSSVVLSSSAKKVCNSKSKKDKERKWD